MPSSVSFPAPPVSVSSPEPPLNASLPGPPVRISFPPLPKRESTPDVPVRILAVSSPTISSSLIVNVPVASRMVVLVGFDNVNIAVSLASSILSERIGTVKVLLVSPGAKVNVPLTAV